MDYSGVSHGFFVSVTESLPSDWKVSSDNDGCVVTQWFEPDAKELVAQSVQMRGGQPSYLVHKSYSFLEQHFAAANSSFDAVRNS